DAATDEHDSPQDCRYLGLSQEQKLLPRIVRVAQVRADHLGCRHVLGKLVSEITQALAPNDRVWRLLSVPPLLRLPVTLGDRPHVADDHAVPRCAHLRRKYA